MGTKIKCAKCEDIIEGDMRGNMISCKCNSVGIDETPFYYRVNGNPEDVLVERDNKWVSLKELTDKVAPDRIDKTNYYLNIAEAALERSTCLKRKYGAIIVNNDEIISTGYNGAPRGSTSCLQRGRCLRQDSERGTDYSNCVSCHAEQNAIISASRQEMINSTMYLVGKLCENGKEVSYVENPSPCSLCKRMIINAGISKVIVRETKTEFKVIYPADWEEKDIIGGY